MSFTKNKEENAESKIIIYRQVFERVEKINTILIHEKNMDFDDVINFWELIFKLAKNWQKKENPKSNKLTFKGAHWFAMLNESEQRNFRESLRFFKSNNVGAKDLDILLNNFYTSLNDFLLSSFSYELAKNTYWTTVISKYKYQNPKFV